METKDKVVSVVLIVLISVVVFMVGHFIISPKAPKEEITVVGRVFFDNPHYGVAGLLDSADYPAGGGITIEVGQWKEIEKGNWTWQSIAEVHPNEYGEYQFSVPPGGEYSIQIGKEAHIASVYPGTMLYPSWELSVWPGETVAGPVVFCSRETAGLG